MSNIDNETKVRLLGYYSRPNQIMKPESERIEEANELAPLLCNSIQSLYQNPETDEELKKVILAPTVFVFKNEAGNLVAYFTKDKIARVTGVVYSRSAITQVPLKYKAWFYPGQSINLITQSNDDASSSVHEGMDSSSESKGIVSNNTKREGNKRTSLYPLRVEREEIERVKTRLRLENNYFIGQFSPGQRDGWYKISDIRNTDFTKIEDKERGIKNLTISFRSKVEFNRFAYYKFTWVLLQSSPLKFGINLREEIVPIYPEDIVRCLHDSIIHYPASAAKKITRTLDTLNKQLTQSGKEVFIYELLQNANDYPRKHKEGNEIVPDPVDVEFHITDDYLTFQHTGDYFNAKNIAAICDINDGEKSENVEAIGYKGIGFKTVFLDNDFVYLSTGKYSFRFDKSATDIINTPWQILPVWTDLREVNPTIKSVFRRHPNEVFRVKFALKPRDRKILTDRKRNDNYIDLFSSVFDSERVILFIPNIRKVRVFWGDSLEPKIIREKSSSHWCVSEALTDEIPEDICNRINDVLTNPDADKSGGYDKIPEKYLNFKKTAVKFACEREGRKLLPVKDAILYCYLPAKRADWGFKFLMNTDMVPNGARDDIADDVELNHVISKIAGRQFFYWIKSLIEEGYDASSVFDLIPSFKDCKSGIGKSYEKFISKFEEGFYEKCKTEAFIPTVSKDGVIGMSKIADVLYDSTHITMSGFLSDSEFYSISGETSALPILSLRSNDNLRKLFRHIGANHHFDQSRLVALCEKEAFQKWLLVQENNNNWIDFIIDRNYANLFVHKKIFINGRTNSLEESSNLLYYSKQLRKELSCFIDKYINYLSDESYNYLKQDEKSRYQSLVNAGYSWQLFYPYRFAESVLNCKEDYELLKTLNNSIGFYHMIARNREKCFSGDFAAICKKFPLIVDEGILDSIDENVIYFNSQEGLKYKTKPWVDKSWFHFLPKEYIEYDKDVMEPFFKRYVSSFSETNFISNILLKSDHVITINKKISEKYEDNLDFYRLMYKHREGDTINDGSLQHYCLHAFKINGESTYVIPKESPVYFNNIAYEDFIKRPWLENEWLYSFDVSYLRDLGDNSEESKKSIMDFFEKKCKVRISQKAKFCTEVAMPHLSAIIQAINIPKKETDNVEAIICIDKIKKNNFDFLHYLSENYSTVFEGNTNYFNDKSFPFIDSEGNFTNGPLSVKRFYSISSDVDEISSLTWLPDGYVKVISNEYKQSFDDLQQYTALTKKLGIYDFDYNGFLTDVVLQYKQEIVNCIKEIEANVSFHKFFRNHIDKITPENIKKIADFPVFIIGDGAPLLSESSKGHLLTDNRLAALINEGFLPASSIDGICKVYLDGNDKDKKYWVDTLENREINIPAIVSLLTIDSVKQTISKSVEDNVRFWRLLFSFKDIKSANLTLLKSLPIIMKKGSETESSLHILGEEEECYLSDSYYSDGGAIEYLVKEYAENSWLLSSIYIQDQPTESKKDWFVFWQKVGILSSNEDILLHTIIPHLNENVDEKIPILLYNNKTLIEEKINDEMKEDFKQLHLCTNNGLRKIGDVYFIQEVNGKLLSEPLPEFPLSNQISPSYSKDQVEFFLSLTDLSLSVITSQAEWFQPKIDQYLSIQEKAFNDSLDKSVRESNLKIIDAIHYEFIKNLAKFKPYNNVQLLALSLIGMPFLKLWLKRSYDNSYVKAETLTLGTAYKPYCDFESHGIPQLDHKAIATLEDKPKIIGLDYISNVYSTIKDIIPLLNNLGVHHKFIRKDKDLLANHDFCVYFWTDYVLHKDRWKEVNTFIDEGVFENLPCVPTNNTVKKPSDLYSRVLIDYVKRLSGGADLIPLDIKKDITGPDGTIYPHPIYKFNYLSQLSKEHCFEFLCNSRNVELKKAVLKVLLDYKDNDQLDLKDIEEYRRPESNAVWMNGQNEPTHISRLYAIGKDDTDAMYNIYLGSDKLVISNTNIPDTRFEDICSQVLGMKVLHAKDGVFETIPTEPKIDETASIVSELKQKSFLLATILCEDTNWLEPYEQYKTNIERLKFVKCQSISIEYIDDRRLRGDDVATVHFDPTSSTFFYVNDWQDKFVFDQLLNFLIKEIGIDSSQSLMIKRILDTNRRGRGIDEYVDKFCKKYYSDSNFVDVLVECYPDTAKNLRLTEALKTEDGEGFVSEAPEYNSTMKESHGDSSEMGLEDSPKPTIDTNELTNRSSETSTVKSQDQPQGSSENSQPHEHEFEKTERPASTTERDDTSMPKTPAAERGSTHDGYDNDSDVENNEYDPDQGDPMGSVDRDTDYDPIGSVPRSPRRRRHPKPYTPEELDRLRSHGSPLQLESLAPTDEEIDILAHCGISVEQIADTNYLAQLRLYQNLIDQGVEPEETREEFVKNADDVTTHILKNGKYIHTCSAARGVMYISPSVWNKVVDGKWVICVYLDGQGKNFHFINSAEEFLDLVKKDDVVIKITGKEKVDVVRTLYSGLLSGTKGTAYTLIRVASRTNMDAVFAHYVGAMAEADDGNEY